MVPMELLMLEDKVSDDSEHHKGDTLLDNLQLHEVEGTAIIDKTQTVGGYLTAIFEESDHPRKGDHQIQGPVSGDARLLQVQMPIPGEGHKHIAHDEQQNRINTVCHTSVTH